MMNDRHMVTVDGNEAVASVAHRTNEVIAIYPITPASPMGELADAWSVEGRRNIWGMVPDIVQMQSEGGAAGAVHGSLQAGALTTTFTASQGLLMMIPNMYKIAGELTPFCMHVAARTLATHALSIFADHSDVMAVRQTGFALLASGSVQEAHDFASMGQAATLRSRVPFLHFMDGFRTSHEVSKIEMLSDEDLRFMIDDETVTAHRSRALTPDRPVIRGTAQNSDTFFQAREACNPFYLDCPGIVQSVMNQFARRTGRSYHLFDYFGHPEAERVIVLMGSGAETVHETADWLLQKGEPVGVLKVRLYRPFSATDLIKALPSTVRSLAVLDRTKEPGAIAEPLHLDVNTALQEASSDGNGHFKHPPRVIGGRYGLSSKEFTPAMVDGIFNELADNHPKNHFTVGIVDDVTHTSLPVDTSLEVQSPDMFQAIFYGLGSDGTVGANKNSIKIIGQETDNFAQGYFVYDSRKAGAVTISHLRFGPSPIRAPYLVQRADFLACHQFDFLDRFELLDPLIPGGMFLLNTPLGVDGVWEQLPCEVQQTIIEKGLRFYAIDAYKVARESGLGVRINTIMQTCFFALSKVLPKDLAVKKIKEAIQKAYGKRGPMVVQQNFAGVDQALSHLGEVRVPQRVSSTRRRPPIVSEEAPDFVQRVTAVMLANKGDHLPVSAFPVDGTWPVGTSKWEKSNLASEIPIWDPVICIQCNHCALVCPHAAIRAKVYEPDQLTSAPESFLSTPYRAPDLKGLHYSLQVAPEDCTGCNLCVVVCPAKDKSNPRHKAIDMQPQPPLLDREIENYRFFLDLPETEREKLGHLDTKRVQFLEPLFEYSGACSGCGETPYVKLLTQLFGDRLLIANATGCSSIYGGNLPTTPFTCTAEGRGPAWSNSLFEDNAEFGFGFRLAIDALENQARELLRRLSARVGDRLVKEILEAEQNGEAAVSARREQVVHLRRRLAEIEEPDARRLEEVADYLTKKSVWLVGGDGWAYDIGYGGLDHVLSQNRNVNVLVLDTEVYSNTGGQQSKATPLAASAKFAVAGKETPKKDLGMAAMSYGHVYVAQVAFGADMNQVTRAFVEAESFPGPSLIIAYSHCIAHGYDLSQGAGQQKLATRSGMWPLYRFDPRRVREGKPPLHLDSREPKIPLTDYMQNEARFRMVKKIAPERFRRLVTAAERGAKQRFAVYKQLAQITIPRIPHSEAPASTPATEEES